MNPGSSDAIAPVDPENDPDHSRNFLLGVIYYCCLRIGWIFKTESIIMPAVLDVMGGAGWLRGCLPMLNRLGQSVPPFLLSDRVRNAPHKKWIMIASSMTMGSCFLALSLLWLITGGQAVWYVPLIFLVIYAIFFAATGINQMVVNTLIGKLIKTRRRGLLSLVGTGLGAFLAVVSAWWLLNRWLVDGPARGTESRFDLIFAFTGVMFIAAAVGGFWWKERPDAPNGPARSAMQLIAASARTIRTDRNFLLLAIIAGLFGMSITLFPHYQRMGRDRFDVGLLALIPWVLAQNIGAAVFSVPAGWATDRFGTRLVLRTMLLVVCIGPISALVLSQFPDAGLEWFTGVFFLLGITPVTMRIFNYYALEISVREDHPRYLSTLSLAMALPPILLSSFFGALVDWAGFEFVFVMVTCCMFAGWVLTFWLREPRHA